MPAYLRSGFVLVVAVTLSVGITTLPIRAADESKSLAKRIKKLEQKVATLQAKLKYVSVVDSPINGLAGPHMIFEGCNVHIRSGSGNSTDGTVDLAGLAPVPNTTPSGLGNLVLGYNEEPLSGSANRAGSHNLIVGPGHNYSSVAGVLFGQQNSALGPLASVSGGIGNVATGYTASISGGRNNRTLGPYSAVSGGYGNDAIGDYSSVSGGTANDAGGDFSSVSGGYTNIASGYISSISGGVQNIANGESSSVAGGDSNTASGKASSIGGGGANIASGEESSVSGGDTNTASAGNATVSGGAQRTASGYADWAAGSLSQDG